MYKQAKWLTGLAMLLLGMSLGWAASTSLEITGILRDGSGNRITASPYIAFSEGLYDSPTGGTLLAQLGPENVQVHDGSFLQVFSLDDSLFENSAYLQFNLNGFDMAPRLGIFFNGTNYFANGVTTTDQPLFQLYTGMAANVPEPEMFGMLLVGLAFVGVQAMRRRGM